MNNLTNVARNLSAEVSRVLSMPKASWGVQELTTLLQDKTDPEDDQVIFDHAAEMRNAIYGNKCFVRGIIEFGNECMKNCNYCGIRRDADVDRYLLDSQEVLTQAEELIADGYPGVVLQSGEINTEERVEWLANVCARMKLLGQKARSDFRIILSVGELTKEQYARLHDAGADRFLLRIETSDVDLYYKLHPQDKIHDFEARLAAIEDLKATGFQVATGILIGVPGQTYEHLAKDALFMKNMGIHMIGMGPYVPADGTPLVPSFDEWNKEGRCGMNEDVVQITARMAAVCRLIMPDTNIASTTALSAWDKDQGQIRVLRAGANVLMPVYTPLSARKKYSLYREKSNLGSTTETLKRKAGAAGLEVEMVRTGDPHRVVKARK